MGGDVPELQQSINPPTQEPATPPQTLLPWPPLLHARSLLSRPCQITLLATQQRKTELLGSAVRGEGFASHPKGIFTSSFHHGGSPGYRRNTTGDSSLPRWLGAIRLRIALPTCQQTPRRCLGADGLFPTDAKGVRPPPLRRQSWLLDPPPGFSQAPGRSPAGTDLASPALTPQKPGAGAPPAAAQPIGGPAPPRRGL